MTAKTKTGVYTLTRDSDGDVAVWPEEARLQPEAWGLKWWQALSNHHGIRGDSEKEIALLRRMFPAIRKGTRARVRVTVEVIDG